jgi:hypothetical protein
MKTREEVEQLKSAWLQDSWDDLEVEEGYGEYFTELILFRRRVEQARIINREKRHKQLESYICPEMSDLNISRFTYCQVEKCAFWDSNFEKCLMILPAYFESCQKARSER